MLKDVITVTCEQNDRTDWDCRVYADSGVEEYEIEGLAGVKFRSDVELRETADDEAISFGGSSYRRGTNDTIVYLERSTECRIDAVDRLDCRRSLD